MACAALFPRTDDLCGSRMREKTGCTEQARIFERSEYYKPILQVLSCAMPIECASVVISLAHVGYL